MCSIKQMYDLAPTDLNPSHPSGLAVDNFCADRATGATMEPRARAGDGGGPGQTEGMARAGPPPG